MTYRMYVDECGTDDIVSCHLEPHRHLALTGVIISHQAGVEHANPGLTSVKDRHFPRADPDAVQIVLHRSDFLAGKGPFQALQTPANLSSFSNDLFDYLRALEHTVITVVIDKLAMLRKHHWTNKEPYHYCAEVLVEKFVQFLERADSTGDVWAESRKDRKNRALQHHFTSACQAGTRYVADPARIAARLSTFDIEFREKRHNCTGLQLADIYAKPSMDRILMPRIQGYKVSEFSRRFGQLLVDHKYDRSPSGWLSGYGMKHLP